MQRMQELSTGDRLEEMETFVAVADAGSFAAASKRLGRDPSVLSRRITALERRLGVRLLARSTRHIGLTEVGAEYLTRVQVVLAELADADAAISRSAAAPRGTLRLALPAAFGRLWIAPLLPQFLAAHPSIRIEAQFTDRLVDIIAERIDVAIRLGTPKPSGLTARQLAPFARVLCASPDYLERRGAPATPADLAEHAGLGFLQPRSRPIWRLRNGDDRTEIQIDGLMLADDGEALLTAALGGSGILLASDWLVGRELADGRLIRVLPDWSASDGEAVNAVLPPGRLVPAKARAFIDWVATILSPRPPWRG
ncbi:MAG: LysR family transcriptional regulator [Ancalomicrobiaceae bacterium]|nr:LysR family transcriptional regulator [Ancalomicrobiaceae bacterium]